MKTMDEETKFAKQKQEIFDTLIPDLMRTAKDICCTEQIIAFKKLCAPITPTIKAIGSQHMENRRISYETSHSPPNKKIKPQRNMLHSTRNKKKPATASKRLVNPTIEEKQEIALTAILYSKTNEK